MASLLERMKNDKENKKKEQKRKLEEACVEIGALKDELEGKVNNRVRSLKKIVSTRPGDRAAKEREYRTLKSLLSQYWYVSGMYDQVCEVFDRVRLLEDLKNYGDAMHGAVSLLKGMKTDLPDISKIVKEIQKVLEPIYTDLPDLGKVDTVLFADQASSVHDSMDDFIDQIVQGSDWSVPPQQEPLTQDQAPRDMARQGMEAEINQLMNDFGRD